MTTHQLSTLVATVTALLGAVASGCGTPNVEPKAPSADTPATEEQPVRCEGINECAGTSECKSSDGANECKGLNSCAGQGWIYADTEQDCTDAGGAVI